MLKAVIFDMDGILVDSEGYQFEAFRQILEPKGAKITKTNFEWVGRSAAISIREALAEHNIDGHVPTLVKKRQDVYKKLIENHIKPMSGALELVQSCATLKRAVATSSSRQQINLVMKGLGLCDTFDTIVSSEDVQRGKPKPDIYLRVLQRLNLKPEECIAIEDSKNGVLAATTAGIKCVAVPNQYTKRQSFAKAHSKAEGLDQLSLEKLQTIHSF